MERFDKTGRLIFPEPKRLAGARKKGIVVEKEQLHITQAFCPKGDELITEQAVKFGGKPGIRLWVKGKTCEQMVTLSPFQGDPAKAYEREFDRGEVLEVSCPKCKVRLPLLAPCGCRPDSYWIVMFLERSQDYDHAVGVCNAWGCPKSFIRACGEILTEYRVSVEV